MMGIINSRIWKTAIETMQEGLMLVDTRGKIRFVNRAFEDLLGYNNEELVGRSCEIFRCDRCFQVRANGVNKYCALFKEKKVIRAESVFRRKDGSAVHLLKNAGVIYDEHGKVCGGVETLTDLSRIKAGEETISSLKKQLERETGFAGIIGRHYSMRRVFDLAESVAASDIPVMIVGESGTGKELLADAIHRHSPRASGPLVKVNCAALNENILESELFGHVKGAFTGADRQRIGRFEAADRGSIFLDEIGDITPATQSRLLRVLQEHAIERVGDNRPIRIDVRIITATNKDLTELIRTGLFREDLFYRINVVPIEIPPLRQRKSDIPLLVNGFIRRISARTGRPITRISAAALELLGSYHWPGNVRELINVIEYAFVVCPGDRIGLKHLPPRLRDPEKVCEIMPAIPASSGGQGRDDILVALESSGWNRTKAAKMLGVSRVTLWKWMKRHGIG